MGGNGKAINGKLIGTNVAIILKNDQRTGRLTHGVVADILTNSPTHPRGIKVRLVDGSIGRIQKFDSNQTSLGSLTTSNQFRNKSRTQFLNDSPESGSKRAPTIADWIPDLSPKNKNNFIEEWTCTCCTFINSGFLLECEI
ncbi:hypothetical protein HK096_000051, partial [Nowakowskiella sp. JEL0078]